MLHGMHQNEPCKDSATVLWKRSKLFLQRPLVTSRATVTFFVRVSFGEVVQLVQEGVSF
jgi:hypothetical protein